MVGRHSLTQSGRVLGPGIAIVILSLNLRPAVTSVGSVVPDMIASHVPIRVVDIVVALPTFGFAIGGAIMPLVRRLCGGTRQTVSSALIMLVLALLFRALGAPGMLLAGTALAYVAIGVTGAVLPVIIRNIRPSSKKAVSAGYVAALGLGSTVGAMVTPVVAQTASWKVGIGAWLVLSVLAIAVWHHVASERHCDDVAGEAGRPTRSDEPSLGLRAVITQGSSWIMTVHFGVLSMTTIAVMGWLPAILRQAGVDPFVASASFGVAMILGVPVSLAIPSLIGCTAGRQTTVIVVLTTCTVVGVTGLRFAPTAAPLLWATFLGIGLGIVAVTLSALAQRATVKTAFALSSMVQGFGYAVAGLGLVAIGQMHTVTGGWGWPLIILLGALMVQAVTGVLYSIKTAPLRDRKTKNNAPTPDTHRSDATSADTQNVGTRGADTCGSSSAIGGDTMFVKDTLTSIRRLSAAALIPHQQPAGDPDCANESTTAERRPRRWPPATVSWSGRPPARTRFRSRSSPELLGAGPTTRAGSSPHRRGFAEAILTILSTASTRRRLLDRASHRLLDNDNDNAASRATRTNLRTGMEVLTRHLADHPGLCAHDISITNLATAPTPTQRGNLHLRSWSAFDAVVRCGKVQDLLRWYRSLPHGSFTACQPPGRSVQLKLIAPIPNGTCLVLVDAPQLSGIFTEAGLDASTGGSAIRKRPLTLGQVINALEAAASATSIQAKNAAPSPVDARQATDAKGD